MKKKSIIFILFIILVGVIMVAYPTVSNWWNARTQSTAMGSYIKNVKEIKSDENLRILEEANAYNKKLSKKSLNRLYLTDEEKKEYKSLLSISGFEIMGIVEIPKFNIKLPIYHGIDDATLQIAVGHLPGTSLPVGGLSTHSVISGHTGLRSARLFTDIENMNIGDIFFITSLGNELVYEVDQIKTVLPNELVYLKIEKDKDYVTLQTCTPYGINTHRLLVRGKRINTLGTRLTLIPDVIEQNKYVINFIVIIILMMLIKIYRFIIKTFLKYIKKEKRKVYEK